MTIHEAKTSISRLIQKVCRGEEVVIARGSQPVAKLVPLSNKASGTPKPGALKGKVTVGPEFFEDLPADELLGWG